MSSFPIRLRFAAVCFFTLLVFCINLPAQDKNEPLTLEKAWQIVTEENLSLQQLEKSIQQAEKQVKMQKAALLPELALTGSYQYVSELAKFELPLQIPGLPDTEIEAGVNNQYDAALVIRQPVFTGFRLLNQIDAAKSRQQVQQIQRDVLQQQLLLQVGTLYYNIQLNLKQQDVLRQSIQRLQLQRNRISQFLEVGRATEFDTLEVAIRILQLESNLQSLSNVEQVLISRLENVLDAEDLPALQRIGSSSLDLTLQPLDAYYRLALQKRPELEQVKEMQKIQHHQKKIAQSALFPQINALASYHYARPGVNFFEDEWMNYYTIGAQLQWKLWGWKQNQRQVQVADLEMQKLFLQEAQLKKDLKQQVTEAFRQLESIRQQIETQQQLLAQEEKRYRLAQDQFSEGVISSIDLNSIENDLTSAELMLEQKYIEWLQDKLQLDFATGRIKQ